MVLDKTNSIIKLENVSKNYAGQHVLKSINLEISRGQIVGYIGQNGAGKTTTVKILIGVVEEFEGGAAVCGYDVKKYPLEVKKRIGYVPEVATLYDALTPLEYLQFVGQIYHMHDAKIEQRATELLTILGMEDALRNPIGGFSKGMKQKVLLTSAMIHNPEVIFLDEPLSGLDANSVILVKEIITGLAKSGKTIFYCSHIMDVVERVCDRIIILSKGTIVADGSFDQLQEIEKESSLELIFTQITGRTDHNKTAERFLDVLES